MRAFEGEQPGRPGLDQLAGPDGGTLWRYVELEVEQHGRNVAARRAVQAGWFDVVVDPWWIPAREVTLGNRVDLILED